MRKEESGVGGTLKSADALVYIPLGNWPESSQKTPQELTGVFDSH